MGKWRYGNDGARVKFAAAPRVKFTSAPRIGIAYASKRDQNRLEVPQFFGHKTATPQ